MQLTQEKFHLHDQVMSDYLVNHPELEDRWLLEQTLHTGPVRRSIFEYFPFQPHSSVLDAGTGFGALALGLAGQIPVTVHALDSDESKLQVAKRIRDALNEQAFFRKDSHVQFDNGDLYALPYEDGQFDFVVARFVYQHLRDPLSVTEEIKRVMRPNGYICIIDIDDQFTVSYPEASGAFRSLQKAFAELQAKRGGDRYVGRKLSTYLQRAGFEIQATAIQPQAQHRFVRTDDVSKHFMLNRLSDAKDEIVEYGILDDTAFDAYIDCLAHEPQMFQFNAAAQVVVIAQKI